MVEHQSKEVVDKMSEDLKIQPALALPRNINPSIQPVYVVNPVPGVTSVIQSKGALASDATTATIWTTHPIKKTFVIGINVSVAKDVNSTSVSTNVQAILRHKSSAGNILTMRYEPLTAASNLIYNMTYPIPMELEKNTLVTVNNSSAVASIDAACNVLMFEVDPL